MMKTNNNKFIFDTFETSRVKSIFVYDFVLGTIFYYGFKALCKSELISLVGCIAGTEVIKKFRNYKIP